MTKVKPQQIWQGFHWLFFVNIQGLIICLHRLEISLMQGNLTEAQTELETATDLMRASGAAMELAGSFSPQDYEHQIRPSMAPPHVKSNDFSGLMSWDHASLMEVWKRLTPTFAALPAGLASQHEQFVAAYFSLTSAHRAVCQRFGGDTIGSLRCDQETAVRTLDKFAHNRWRLIDPNFSAASHCPFHPDRS